jgi:hypothetical protein
VEVEVEEDERGGRWKDGKIKDEEGDSVSDDRKRNPGGDGMTKAKRTSFGSRQEEGEIGIVVVL